MNVYVVTGEENYISAIFTTREAAELSFPGEAVEEFELCESILPPWTYWHRGAAVYPDGSYEEWTHAEVARGHVGISACDDHLNERDDPWDGHTQGHCGEHISIFGTDRELLEVAFRKHLAASIARQNGTCQSKFGQHRHGDGRTVYEVDWFGKTRPSHYK